MLDFKQYRQTKLYSELDKQYQNVQSQLINDAIEICIGCKVVSKNQFLLTKLGFKDLKHRKIVQNIFSKYIPVQQQIELNFSFFRGEISENFEQLVKGMKVLPVNLGVFYLNLTCNNLGNNMNMNLLVEIMKALPNNLQKLKLDLSSNKLGDNTENMKLLVETIKQMPYNLLHLELNFYLNNLGDNSENLKWLAEGLKKLPKRLKHLTLDFQSNKLGDSPDNLKWLGEGIKKLHNNLQELTLILYCNKLEDDQKQKFKDGCLDVFSRLQKLDLKINDGDFHR